MQKMEQSSSSCEAVDVVTVVDFRGENAAIYEGQALLLLASFMQHAGRARMFPFHFSCIGEPPNSVKTLAEEAGAHIHLIEPSGWRSDHFVGNKVRGLEIPTLSDRILLIDPDLIVLGDFSEVCRYRDCLAAGLDNHPKVSMEQWRHIYESLEEPFPEDRGSCIISEGGLPTTPRAWQHYQVPRRELRETLPYFNSGVVVVPVDWEFSKEWNTAYDDIAGTFHFNNRSRRSVLHSDQAAFALAAQRSLRVGRRFETLPASLHSQWRHLFIGEPSIEEMSILHLTTFLKTIRGRVLTDAMLREAVVDYFGPKMTRRMTRFAIGHAIEGSPSLGCRRLQNGKKQCRQLSQHVLTLCDQIVSPILRGASLTQNYNAKSTVRICTRSPESCKPERKLNSLEAELIA